MLRGAVSLDLVLDPETGAIHNPSYHPNIFSPEELDAFIAQVRC